MFRGETEKRNIKMFAWRDSILSHCSMSPMIWVCVCMCEDFEWPRCFSCDFISNQNLWDEQQRSERVDAEHFLELDTSSVHMHTQQLTAHINRDLVCWHISVQNNSQQIVIRRIQIFLKLTCVITQIFTESLLSFMHSNCFVCSCCSQWYCHLYLTVRKRIEKIVFFAFAGFPSPLDLSFCVWT